MKTRRVFRIATILLCLLLGMAGYGYWYTQPTHGEPISPSPIIHNALLVIDIQEDFTGPKAIKPYRTGNTLVRNTNLLISQAQQRGIPVFFIRNLISNPFLSLLTGGLNTPGTAGVALDRRLLQPQGSVRLTKHRMDAFSNPELSTQLQRYQVNRLLITGIDGAHCVMATAKGGIHRGYEVFVYPDAVATKDQEVTTLIKTWQQAGIQVCPQLTIP